MNANRKILITCALPYANGYIHLGHLVEYLQADFWARFQNMRGHECIFICADDTHGTPIMVKAREMGITPETLIAKSYEEHTKDFSDFQVKFSLYASTNSLENRELCEHFYHKMVEGKHTRSQGQRTRSKASVKKIRTIPTSLQRGKLPNGKISK